MTARVRLGCAGLCFILPLMAACKFSEVPEARACTEDDANDDCPEGQTCYRGFCIREADAGNMTETDPSTDPPDARPPEEAGPAPQPDAGSDAGNDSAMPEPDASEPDVECASDQLRACRLPPPPIPSADSCRMGQQRCQNGRFGPCLGEVNTTDETCDGLDDDCDGRIDEHTDEVCYPNGSTGCTQTNEAWVCMGLCIPGYRTCRDGVLQPCEGATTPDTEECTPDGETAGDESCDGAIDETCVCSGNESRACYTGPVGTAGVGRCAAGTQRCDGGMFSDCTGSIVPVSETCANEGSDDDCDRTLDDVQDRDAACIVTANFGACRLGTLQCRGTGPALTCVTPEPIKEACNGIDDDCNGGIDDAFDFQNDPQHCGDCATTCGAGELCCAGTCVNPNSDAAHCGGCGPANACPTGNACCSGMCTDLTRDPTHCGTCERACGRGTACCSGSCADTEEDVNNCGTCGTTCRGTQPACCSGECADLVTDAHCGGCGVNCQERGPDCVCQADRDMAVCGGDCG